MGQCASRPVSRDSRGRWQHGGVDGSSGGPGKGGCWAMVREQKSRFYIARRCIVMLLCWHIYGKLNRSRDSRSN
ncbi:hypothetical protein ACJRO7_035789 [Eucalyptus globulus]|uniref:Uncharacterized protein n=1 Tax=Eucalyptus globulus TaxID=34317 RepID=A0ABD3J778_EUCGL